MFILSVLLLQSEYSTVIASTSESGRSTSEVLPFLIIVPVSGIIKEIPVEKNVQSSDQWRIQDFPEGRCQLPKWHIFCRKLHENERISTPMGGGMRPWYSQ